MQTTFAQSPFWQWQRQYFEEAQINAWRKGEVPHYVTSNPHMAETYARVLLGFLRDCNLPHLQQTPVYMVELGAGSGRFSYHVLKALSRLLDAIEWQVPPFVYIMTDFVEANLDFWETHPRLQPFFGQGILDYALFDAEKDSLLHLRKANQTIDKQSSAQPLAVIANYFFDSIPQDLFYINEGKAATVLVQPKDDDAEKTSKEQLARLELHYTYEPLATMPYQQPRQRQLFGQYQQTLTNSHLLFPQVGLNCIERLKELSPKGMLLITADKAAHRLEKWQNRAAPHVAKHGSISMTANYHALKEHCRLLGGKALFPNHPVARITVGALLYLDTPHRYPETLLSYQQQVNATGSDEYFSIKKHIEQQIDQLSSRELFAYTRLSCYDARLFYQFLPRFQVLADTLNEDERFALLQLVARVWDGYYPLGERNDLAFEIGSLLLKLDFFREAFSFLELSEQIYGKKDETVFAKAVCCLMLNEQATSVNLLQDLLDKNPGHEAAQTLLQELAMVV